MGDKDNACADVEECLFVGVLGGWEGLRGTRGRRRVRVAYMGGIRGRASVVVMMAICTGRDKDGQIGGASGTVK